MLSRFRALMITLPMTAFLAFGLSACATETHEGVVRYVVASFDTDFLDGVSHVVRGYIEKALCDGRFGVRCPGRLSDFLC